MQVATVTAAAPFSQTNTCTAAIAPAASCTIAVVFAPVATGPFSGALTITGNAGAQTVSLTGTGSAQVTASPSSLSFGTLAVGNTSAATTVTLTNRGSAAVSISNIGTSGAFAIASNTCPASLAAGANCILGVTFTPSATGAATGALTFADSALNSPQTVSLSGTGSSTSSPVTLSASALSFGTLSLGNTSAPVTVTLTNRQSASLAFSGIGISGPFAIASNICGVSLAAGVGCAVGVTFTPTAAGAATGALTFTDSAANSPQKVSLTGTGSPPVTLSASALSFGVVAVGAASASQVVTVTNASATAVAVNGVTMTGDFADTATCASSLPAGKSCTVTVTFTPSVGGARTGTLTFSLSTGAQTVSLTGTGSSGSQSGALSLSPSTLSFSGYTIGDNPSKTVTVKNASGASVGIAGIAMGGDSSFTQRNNCGVSLAVGAACSITVTFKPVAYGAFTGALTVTEGSGALDTISVTGASSPNN
jgi:hypothetical protein